MWLLLSFCGHSDAESLEREKPAGPHPSRVPGHRAQPRVSGTSFCLSACLAVYLSVCLFVCLCVCLSVSLFVCLPFYLPLCLSVLHTHTRWLTPAISSPLHSVSVLETTKHIHSLCIIEFWLWSCWREIDGTSYTFAQVFFFFFYHGPNRCGEGPLWVCLSFRKHRQFP